MSIDQKLIQNLVMMILQRTPVVDGELIRSLVRKQIIAITGSETEIDELSVESISRAIEEIFDLTMGDSSTVKRPFNPWHDQRKSQIDPVYWSRYRTWLEKCSFAPKVLGQLDIDTDKITGLLEDPVSTGGWKRRGLVVGHVQSGKTANYIGVICKAADAGYRFIVLLAGMHNNLRRQTQERIDEGFIGVNTEDFSSRNGGATVKVGVGLDTNAKRPIFITTRSKDFNKNSANSAGISFDAVKEPIILVIKKNKTIIANLTEWLRQNNPFQGGRIRNVPMLLIDDEADSASVNTADTGEDPKAINRKIRELLQLFEQNCYVGYTATPFANIFIDPDSSHDMLGEDLFPRDFIISLDAPNNYMGPFRLFDEDGDLSGLLKSVDDNELLLPAKHKIDHRPSDLPPSLYKAIRCFVLARALRCLRGHSSQHNSMLVNVSRFTEVQKEVARLISNYLSKVQNSVRLHAALPMKEALQDIELNNIYKTWQEEFANEEEDWEKIQGVLQLAAPPIKVKIINTRSPDVLNYELYKDNGLNVIAVGGLSLSRGFTLEGLTVSYFIRNSIMYDTLMQMGRWFGYRSGYENLCRIFMVPDARSWYSHISEVTDELREEFRLMEIQQSTPEEFGLKVRSHPDSLIITARNKMRSGRQMYRSIALGQRLIETYIIRSDAPSLSRNYSVLESLICKLDTIKASIQTKKNNILWKEIPATQVIEFINGFLNHDEASPNTQSAPVTQYITSRMEDELSVWDVCLFNLDQGKGEQIIINSHPVTQAIRKATKGRNFYKASGEKARVASRGDEQEGLTDTEMADAIKAFEKEKAAGKTKANNISDRYFRGIRKRPLLMLHLLQIKNESDGSPLSSKVVAYGISFPATKRKEEKVRYVVNTTWWQENYADEIEEEDEDERP